MKSFRELTREDTFEFFEYIAKCVAGVMVGYLLLKAFPDEGGQLNWLLISILISITYDNKSKVAYDRMRGNLVGSLVGLVAFLLHHPPNLLTIGGGVVVTIALCFKLDLMEVCRTALVAFIIVMLYEESHGSWTGAVYRLVSVVFGCLIGLLINYLFRKITLPIVQRIENEGKKEHGAE